MSDLWKKEMCSRYDLENIIPIAKGGMGKIYRAWDKNLGRNVAIKTISSRSGALPDDQERFQREMRVLSRLNHHGIVTIYHGAPVAIEATDENPSWYIMEYIDGKSLADHIEDRRQCGGSFTFKEVLLVLAPVAHALDYIHSLNPPLFHRDIKPRNIVVSVKDPQNLKVKIVDFGVAIDTEITQITDVGILVGTEKYLAPELFSNQGTEQELSLSAAIREKAMIDNYSLALTAYEMLTLTSYADFLSREQWRKNRPTPLLDEKSLVGRSKEERENIIYAIYHALHSNVDQRPSTALEFVKMLQGSDEYKEKKERWYMEKFGTEIEKGKQREKTANILLWVLLSLITLFSMYYFISAGVHIDFSSGR